MSGARFLPWPPACLALASCCLSPDNADPSSCNETALGGGLTDAQCGQELATYVAEGQCQEDGAVPDIPDANARSSSQ